MIKKVIFGILGFAFICGTSGYADCCWCETERLRPIAEGTFRLDDPVHWSQGEAETNRIDLLLAFDLSAAEWLNMKGYTDIEAYVSEVISELNEGLANTDLDACFTFRLAGICRLPLNLSKMSLSQVVRNAKNKSKSSVQRYPEFAVLRDEREKCRADIVAILTDRADKTEYGFGFTLLAEDVRDGLLKSVAANAYCACSIPSVMERYTLLHEIGHIMGAGHSNAQRSERGPQLHNYSAGYYFSAGGCEYATVMAYTESGYESFSRHRLPFFSSPDYTLLVEDPLTGLLTDSGVAVGTAKWNDNTRTLRETYAAVANFRVAKLLPGWEDQHEGSDEPADTGISIMVVNGNGEVIPEGHGIDLTRFVNDSFAVKATVPSEKTVKIKVTGLPTGMKFVSKTGIVSGFPKKAGSYAVKIVATCAGEEKKTVILPVCVNDLPPWVIGEYVGLIDCDGENSLATLKVSTTGKVSIKCKCGGRSRTFACSGFSTGLSGVYEAQPSIKIGKTVRSFAVRLENRSAVLEGGRLLQNPWGRRDVVAPKIKRQIKTKFGDFTVKISSKGKATISGRVNGVSVTGRSQIVASFDGEACVKMLLPLVLAPKRGFGGMFQWLTVQIGENCAIMLPVE